MLKLVHTSDWHLGHTLHGLARDEEHARFLTWLLDRLVDEAADALLICGDVFDTASPPVRAERAFFDFLAQARLRLPALEVVVVAGNHDSAPRLEAPAGLLRALGVRVVGGVGRAPGRPLDLERLVAPLHDRAGGVAAWVAAVPYLRPADLPPRSETEASLAEGVRRVYAEVLAEARARRAPGQALLATGHLALSDATPSELSERPLLIGNQDALPADLFPEDLAYVALGHLHRPQHAAGRPAVRYCGAPLALALPEASYPHQVLAVTLEQEVLAEVRPLLVPRAVPILRLPEGGPAPLEQVLPLLEALPARGEGPEALRPYLEVCVEAERADPGLRARIEEALAGKEARLVKLTVPRRERAGALAEAAPAARLEELAPEEVFRRCYQRSHEAEPPPELLTAWRELVAEAEAAGSDAAEAPAAPASAAGQGARAAARVPS